MRHPEKPNSDQPPERHERGRLSTIGFRPVAEWKLSNQTLIPSGLNEETGEWCCALYAFVGESDEVLYVGQTMGTLAKRLNAYRTPGPSQTTNLHCRTQITKRLKANGRVLIYAYRQQAAIRIGEFELCVAAGLENSIIGKLNPPWNRKGDGHVCPLESEPASEGLNKLCASKTVVHPQRITPTYRRLGFFNVSAKQSKFYGAHDAPIRITLPDGMRITGKINRDANTNETPRIMVGPRLRDWFAANIPIGASAQVTVLTPQEIRINTL